MQTQSELSAFADDELLRRLAAVLRSSRHTEADLVAHIGEVDARRLYAREAAPSMWAYCTERLHLSGAEAYLRIAAARACREHPVILEMLADGRLHLSAIAKIAPHLTAENRDALLRRATHKSKQQIEELLAELEPRSDAPAMIRKVPDRRTRAGASTECSSVSRSDSQTASSLLIANLPLTSKAPLPLEQCSGTAVPSPPALRLDEVVSSRSAGVAARPATIVPLAPARYKVQFTASAVLKEKLERLQALMRSSIPDGDLAKVVEAAVTDKLERLEARQFGRTTAPRKDLSATDVTPCSRHVPAAVRRAVDDRDEGRCRYVDEHGHRCTARAWLELHHRHPFAVGGDHSPGNVAILCRTHNRYLAEIDFGSKAVRRGLRADAPRQARSLLT